MLLPSDVARLVLGYLQQEGLSNTSRVFIHESPNLREYAEHSTEDGAVPACVFSLFGKNLITILNEYVAAKAKETCQENQIPAMMTSLWKKLDFTLSQIKSMQNSPAVHQIQRFRTQNSIQNMRRQRLLSSTQPQNVTVSTPGNCVASTISPPPQGMLGHSTPVCYTTQQTRPSTISLSQPGESTLQIVVPDHRFTPGPLSPARRKCDSPRRRGGGQFGSSRNTAVSSATPVESQSQEAVTENLSQMVIENAREKILNDRSLQEKLAENINKILASENSPQISKAACSTVEQEQSIDEILGLQGEIHMTDDAIQDILEQTESDPAFQALFDLFDYGKSRTPEETEQADGSFSNSTQESDETSQVDSATDTGTVPEDSTSGRESTSRKLRSRTVPDPKSTRKPISPPTTKKPSPALSLPRPAGPKRPIVARGPKKGISRGKATLGTKQARSSATKRQPKKKAASESPDQNTSSSSQAGEVVSMQVDLPEAASPQKQPTVPKKGPQTPKVNKKRHNVASSSRQTEPSADVSGIAFNPEKEKMVETSSEQATDADQSERSLNKSALLSNKISQSPVMSAVSLLETESSSNVENISSENATPLAQISASVNISDPKSAEPDPSKIVSLNIIISDEEQQGSDSALNQAVSSISGDRIPTIFLSSPAKANPPPLPPTSSITLEETALAVSSLQVAEAPRTPVVGGAQSGPWPSPARQEAGFFQLLPPSATAFAGPGGYFVVTEATSVSDQHSGVMLGPASSVVAATPPRSRTVVSVGANMSQTFSPASAIIISSPVQPIMQNMAVPVSVFGQNNNGTLAVLPNQVVTLSGPALVSQPAKIVPKPKLALKDKAEMGKAGAPSSSQVSKFEQLKSGSGVSPSHRRILCFDENVNQTNTTSTLFTTAPSAAKELTGNEKVQPCPSDSKKNVEAARPPEPSCISGSKIVKTTSVQQPDATQKETGTSESANITSPSKESSRSKISGSEDDPMRSAVSAPSSKPQHSDVTLDETRCDKRPKSPPQDLSENRSPTVTANKENEVKGVRQDPRQPTAPSSEKLAPTSPPPQGSSGKALSKTSPLTKQAVEMLQDIQSQNPTPTPTPPRKSHSVSADLPLPRTPGHLVRDDFISDGLKTPLRHRAEGTPRRSQNSHLVPPATPDLPTCSPASEAGSENSINMAAHTLMILSRAARTGGALKDSMRQEETGSGNRDRGSKGKKRKHAELSPTAKKELQLSGSSGIKKKSKKQKKLLDSFPLDLDVDKFLSSLHYDE